MAAILIVDRHSINCGDLALLEHSGHHMLEATDGTEAIDIIRRDEPDLVLSDMLSPGKDGYPFFLQVRSEPALIQPVQLLVAATCIEADARALARTCGVAQPLIRPVWTETLIRVVDRVLAEPRSRSESPPDFAAIDLSLRLMARRLNERVLALEQRTMLLERTRFERSEQLDVARSAVEQEVIKRLWAEQELTGANLRLQEKATRDALTGLYNRGYLEESLKREESRARRNKQSLGVMMIDIDHFKRVNDTYGHSAGDEVLRGVGDYMQSLTRGEDILCRYGGEEFALVMTAASPAIMRERAERLRLGVQRLKIESQGLYIGPITLSIGFALFPEHGANAFSVLQAADRALYQAKQSGRNCEIMQEGESASENQQA